MAEPTTPVTPLSPEAMGQVAKLTQKNYNDYAAVSQQLIERLTEDLYRAKAERDLIRESINEALHGPYVPTSSFLLSLLFPSGEQVGERVKFEKEVTS